MERINALIDKIYQQKEQGLSPAQILPTVQLLQSEIVKLQQKNGVLGTSKVAVIMPVHSNYHATEMPVAEIEKAEEPELTPVYKAMQAPVESPQEIKQASIPETRSEQEMANGYFLRKPSFEPAPQEEISYKEEPVKKEEAPRPAVMQSNFYHAFDTVEETPTLMQHQPRKEVHELIGDKGESLNDRLKQEKKEVVNALKDTPIKDLRKGIGINDRFTFVSELFRGDDAMYERSIKTINGFNILSEAEYWINRELKFKLGWNDNKEEVQHFYHLVRRRFA
ncbi:MAG TPA: hypothetical protein VJ499_06045 [Flavisolibacter sp.]|nr:hypothetical protein [Flavisolibacter sp.]